MKIVISMIFHTHYKDIIRMKINLPYPLSSRSLFLVFFILSFLSTATLANEYISGDELQSTDKSLQEGLNGELLSASELSSPMLFLKLLQYQDVLDDSNIEKIRHERQIKFKSSYTELPEVLKQAEEKQNKGKSLSSETVKVITDNMLSPDSAALKDLPPSSEVYFKPEMEDHVNNALTKHFGKVKSSKKNKIHKRTKEFSPSKQIHKFRKRGRLIKKKMVGRKLIRQVIPNPKRVDTDLGHFETSSSEKFENKIAKTVRRGSRRFLFPTRKNRNSNISHSGNHGGPNPIDSFKNPHFVDTSSREESSYSIVPEESFVNFKPRDKDLSRKSPSVTPMPKRIQVQNKRGKKLEKNKKGLHTKTTNHFKPISSKRKSPVRVKTKQRNSRVSREKTKASRNSKSSLTNWDHFLKSSRSTESKSKEKHHNHSHHFIESNPIKVVKKQRIRPRKNKLSSNRGKSLHHTGFTQSMEKRVRQKTGFPDYLNIPSTNFDCGTHHSGEYFADKETDCQVFHVCFGGRQASFICPVGTAFSQNLLVCDWWHKVKCVR